MPENFFPAKQQIVRPFDEKLLPQGRRHFRDRVMDRERGDEGELRPMLRRRGVGQQQAREQIAGLRHPGPTAPPAPAGLVAGGNPKRSALATPGKRQRLGVGRYQHFVRNQPHTGR